MPWAPRIGRAVLAAGVAVAAPSAARAQAPDLPNGALANEHPEGTRLLSHARRVAAGQPADAAAAAYAEACARTTEAGLDWVVPRSVFLDGRYVGVAEAIRMDLRGAGPELRAAWLAREGPRADGALAACLADPSADADDPAPLRAIATRFPLTPAAVRALTRLGDRHLERGAADRAVGCYRRAAAHLPVDVPLPADLAVRIAVATRVLPGLAPTLPGSGEPFALPLALGDDHRTRHPPTLAGDWIVCAGATRVVAIEAAAGAPPRVAWRYVDAAAAAQGTEAARIDREARQFALELQKTPWGRRVELPPPGPNPPVHAAALAGREVVVLLGRPSLAARALVATRRNAAAGRNGDRGRYVNALAAWDGRLPTARTLVALPLGEGPASDGIAAGSEAEPAPFEPAPTWRLGGADGIPGVGEGGDFASPPVATGGDVCLAATATSREFAVHLLTLDARTGRVRSVAYLGSGQRQAIRGPLSGTLRLPESLTVAVHRGVAFVCTNCGIVAACDPDDGAVRWITLYAQRSEGLPTEPGRAYLAPLEAGGGLVVAPVDADHVLWIDSDDGAVRAAWPVDAEAPLRALVPAPAASGAACLALRARAGGADCVALRLPARDAAGGAAGPEGTVVVLAPGGVATDWTALAPTGDSVGLVGTFGWDALPAAGGEPARRHWFLPRRPVVADARVAPGRLVVTTEGWCYFFSPSR